MLTVKSTFVAFSALAVAVTVGSAGLGLWSADTLSADMGRGVVIAKALRNQGEADMMHDALRGDVYRALFASANAPGERAAIEAELAEHLERFRADIRENLALDLPDAAKDAMAEVNGPLDAYGRAGAELVSLAFTDAPAARAGLGAFNEAFATLEDAMEAVSEVIEDEAERIEQESAGFAARASAILLATLIGAPLLVVALCVYLLQSVVRPIGAMTEVMGRLAANESDVEIPGKGRRDEIGAMAASVQVFRENALERARLEAVRNEEHAARERRAAVIDDMVRRFGDRADAALATVASATGQLEGAARAMAGIAEEAIGQATSTAAASEQTSANVQTVATATEELAASIHEITRQVEECSVISREATREAAQTNGMVADLAQAAGRIGDVVGLISSIAGQTNLLALNATIEAARAGEAGKGFAVVASEVKQLASQTAKATEEITAQINTMQSATSGVVEAIKDIGGTIERLDGISGAIAAALQQQNATTGDISRNVHQAAAATETVSGSIRQVTAAAHQTGTAGNQVLAATEQVSREADGLRGQIRDFLSRIKAA